MLVSEPRTRRPGVRGSHNSARVGNDACVPGRVTDSAATALARFTASPSRPPSAAKAQFSEPGGVSVAGGKLYAADTNNHAIRVCDLATGKVKTLEVRC
jgi:hypothetical protein